MKKIFLSTLAFVVFLIGCTNEFRFSAQDVVESTPQVPGNEVTRNPNTDVGNPKPEDPVVVDPDQPSVYPVIYKEGECTKDPLDVLSCMSCQISQRPIEVPLSVKASQLLRVMELGCKIANKSDPVNYTPPTRTQILAYISRATESMYPQSSLTARQKKNLGLWMEGNQDYLGKLFGGLWYHPPYTDDFETYFGLESKEARYLFCYGEPASSFSPTMMAPLHSLEYIQCMEQGFFNECKERSLYVAANSYRVQLFSSLQLSLKDPFNDQEMVPSNRCNWKTMSGFYNLEMENKLMELKNAGYELAVYFERNNPRCEKIGQALISLGSKVTIAAKQCINF
ncbi:MAG: hypothetical protein JNL11_01535 [Bdellovibrionaceae bacterium]|nr:hypothetical protein [Pseudobdellovibrionaceae bacterium]